ncbi:hypothetical protein Avbf_06842 [Armadillidium vulgare]|nr:hypothetical protein Avbf_06842 [Armadillidium vulgare]
MYIKFCSGLQYGYYADPNNNCQIFHVCLPYTTDDGVDETRMWSFLCGEGTVFDQAQLLCNYPEYALPCGEAESLYNINDYFREENVEERIQRRT